MAVKPEEIAISVQPAGRPALLVSAGEVTERED
jgi:hypothetical protein